MNKFKLLITILLSILLLTGCGSQANTQEKNKNETVQEDIQEKNKDETQEDTEEKYNNEIVVQETISEKIVIVSDDNYAKAYSEALVRGLIIPTEEADKIIKRYDAQIKYEPRLVKDTKDKMHIIWTNEKRYLVIDGQDTEIEISECVYAENYPELPRLEDLEEFHKGIEHAKYGIAETAVLEKLVIQLKEKKLYNDGLYWARFYNCDGKAVVVYSLEKDGELYINTQKIK